MKKYLLLATMFTVLTQPVFAMEGDKEGTIAVPAKPTTKREQLHEFLTNLPTNPRVGQKEPDSDDDVESMMCAEPYAVVRTFETGLLEAQLRFPAGKERDVIINMQLDGLMERGATIVNGALDLPPEYR